MARAGSPATPPPTDLSPDAGTPPERPHGIMARHGAAMARHAKVVAVVCLLLTIGGYLVAALGIGGPSLFSRLEVGEPSVSGEAIAGRDLLAANDPSGLSLQGVWSGIDPSSAAVAAEVADAHKDLMAIPGVIAVADPTNLGLAAVSSDSTAVLVSVTFGKDLTGDQKDQALAAAQERLLAMAPAVPGSQVSLTGSAILFSTITDQVEADLRKGEGVSLPLSLLVMVLIFGGFAAAGVPLAGAVAAIAGGLVSLLLFSYVLDLDATVVNVVTVLGLGLCIDYSLLMVSRYREQMHDLFDLTSPGAHQAVPPEVRELAMARTMATAGRTVVFSGVTVAIAVAGLLLIDMTIIQSVGAGAVSVVVIAVLVAITFVPALLVLSTKYVAGAGMLSRAPGFRRFAGAFDHSPSDDGFFSRWAARVQRRPWAFFLGISTVLIVLSIPAWRMTLVSSGVELLPPDNPARAVFTDVTERFPLTVQPDVAIVAKGSDTAALEQMSAMVSGLPGVTRVGPVSQVGNVATMPVFVAEEQGKQVVAAIREARPASPPTYVVGQSAQLVDFVDQLRRDIPLALLTVMGATLVLLFLLTGSVLVPLKALLMNMLSLGATFGLLVLIFQDGRFEGLLGYQSTGGIEAMLPVIIFAFAFGLSMDYEVFLLARIKEFRDTGLDNDMAVRMGLQRTGRIITSAALLIVIVFTGFILGDLLAIKQNGIALALAVLIDATLVRLMLVPATMTLLGEWNWWAPAPLRRLHDRIGVSH